MHTKEMFQFYLREWREHCVVMLLKIKLLFYSQNEIEVNLN